MSAVIGASGVRRPRVESASGTLSDAVDPGAFIFARWPKETNLPATASQLKGLPHIRGAYRALLPFPIVWRTYRKRFLFNQILILMICAILRWAVGTPWRNLGIYLVVMELGGVAGAWWAARIAGRVEQQDRGPFIRR